MTTLLEREMSGLFGLQALATLAYLGGERSGRSPFSGKTDKPVTFAISTKAARKSAPVSQNG